MDYRRTVCRKKSVYWQKRINFERANPRHFWESLNKICGDAKEKLDSNHKADDFASFFQEKVDKIRASMNTASHPIILEVALSELQTFTKTSADEVRWLILNAPNKQCSLDPIPTWLLKECVSDIVPFLVDLFNRTLSPQWARCHEH